MTTSLAKLSSNDQMTAAIRKFLSWLEVTNFSEWTVINRRKALIRFREWCSERGIDTPAEVTRTTLEHYRRYLFQLRKADGTSLKSSTQAYYLSGVSVFFSWLARTNKILFNPASELDFPRTEQMLPRGILKPADVERVLDQPDLEKPNGIRDRAILETFYSTGMRRQELINLELNDIDIDKGIVFIRLGKGGKDRVVPIGQRACDWIEKYVHEIRPNIVSDIRDTTLFLNRHGQSFNPDGLTKMVRNYMKKAGIVGQASCHLLRHSMATSMLENGADIRYIQALLGHANLDNTQIYTKVAIMKLKEVHALTHPARLKKDAP